MEKIMEAASVVYCNFLYFGVLYLITKIALKIKIVQKFLDFILED